MIGTYVVDGFMYFNFEVNFVACLNFERPMCPSHDEDCSKYCSSYWKIATKYHVIHNL